MTATTISEVKNTAYQPWTQQLADYSQYANDRELIFNLYIRSSTQVSSTVQAMEQTGAVNIIKVEMGQ
jgi:hypothetical protein